MAGSKKRVRFNRLRVDPVEGFLIFVQILVAAVLAFIIVFPSVDVLDDVGTQFEKQSRSIKRAADKRMNDRYRGRTPARRNR